MFKTKSLQLPPRLEWKYSNEEPIAEWSLKARPYNTTVANWLFFIFLAISIFLSYRLGVGSGLTPVSSSALGGFLFIILISVALSMTHQKTKFAYRLTKSALEYCEWKEFPEWMLTFLKWFAGITFLGMLAFATVAPMAVFGAILGPGLIGLVYFGMANSSNFRKMHTVYHHCIHEWEVFEKVTVFRRRSIVGLDFTWFNPQAETTPDKMITSTLPIYCEKAGFENTVQLIRSKLPKDIPYAEAYIPIYA